MVVSSTYIKIYKLCPSIYNNTKRWFLMKLNLVAISFCWYSVKWHRVKCEARALITNAVTFPDGIASSVSVTIRLWYFHIPHSPMGFFFSTSSISEIHIAIVNAKRISSITNHHKRHARVYKRENFEIDLFGSNNILIAILF